LEERSDSESPDDDLEAMILKEEEENLKELNNLIAQIERAKEEHTQEELAEEEKIKETVNDLIFKINKTMTKNDIANLYDGIFNNCFLEDKLEYECLFQGRIKYMTDKVVFKFNENNKLKYFMYVQGFTLNNGREILDTLEYFVNKFVDLYGTPFIQGNEENKETSLTYMWSNEGTNHLLISQNSLLLSIIGISISFH
jgi:hypothetical protein